jgi:hypothetical protein
VNRRLPLLALLAIVLAACGTQQSTATLTPEPTPEPTERPTPEPTAEPTDSTDGGSGSTGELADLLPDELDGQPRTDVPGMDQIIGAALSQQGLDAEDAQFAFASYGEGAGGVIVTAMRIPGINQAQLQMLAQVMSGSGGAQGVESEQVTIGGKSVVRMTSTTAGQEGTVLLYFAEDAAFTIVSQDEAAAEQLLSDLP